MRQEIGPGRGQRDAAVRTFEQRCADLALEFLERDSESRLRHHRAPRTGVNATFFSNENEVPKRAQVHSAPTCQLMRTIQTSGYSYLLIAHQSW